MYDSTLELAENKLLLLYIIKSIKYPISNTQLTDIVLENSFINYFMLQQYVSELISSEFLEYKTQDDDKEIIVLTEKGDKVLFFFKDRISPNKLKLIDEYVRKHVEKIKKELKEFLEYKSNYKFFQKDLIQKDECIYCDNELLQDKERK